MAAYHLSPISASAESDLVGPHSASAMPAVENAYDASLPGAGSAVRAITAAFAATSLNPASVDPATITAAAVADASVAVASFADVAPPPIDECVECGEVHIPQPATKCNSCKRFLCYQHVYEHASTCTDINGCWDLTLVRHPHEELYVGLMREFPTLFKTASGSLKAINQLCEESMRMANMLSRETTPPGPPSRCTSSFGAGKGSPCASREQSPSWSTPRTSRKLSFN